MTTPDVPVWWHVARASGLVAWALAAASVMWGLLIASRAPTPARPAWLLQLHRHLGGLTVALTLLHIGALVADDYVHFGVGDVLVPGAAEWRPAAVTWGVIAFWVLLAVEITSLAMHRLPRRLWRAVHGSSVVVFLAATAHLLTAGTDAGKPLTRAAGAVVTAAVLFLGVYRLLGPVTRRDHPQGGGKVQPTRRTAAPLKRSWARSRSAASARSSG